MPSGYAAALVQSIVALAGVCALAVFLLRIAGSRGLGRVPAGRVLTLVERLPLDARSAVCIVRAGDKAWLVGTSDGSAPTLLAELSAEALPTPPNEARGLRSFRALLSRRDEAPGSPLDSM